MKFIIRVMILPLILIALILTGSSGDACVAYQIQRNEEQKRIVSMYPERSSDYGEGWVRLKNGQECRYTFGR